jgi:hypothetical protein
MRSKFRLVLDVVLDTDMATNVIQAAQRHYEAEGSVNTVGENGAARTIAADEFIDEIEDACDGRTVGYLRRVRTRDFAIENSSWPGPGPTEWETTGPAGDGGASGR